MLRGSSKLAKAGALACVLVVVNGALAGSALGAPAPGLPRTYTVQKVDAPLAFPQGRFGAGMINIGDVSGDGKDDLVTVQTAGTVNGNGAIFEINGQTGALIRQANMPDAGNAAGSCPAAPAAPTSTCSLDQSIVDPNIDRLLDIGSCSGGTAGATCPNPVGGNDGVNEILVGAQGVDVATPGVGTVRDVGRAYVFDGATLAVLKRIDMPPADRALEASIVSAADPLLTLRSGGFGRTVQTPHGLPPCAGNAGVGDCAADSTAFPGVPLKARIGDMDGGGRPEIVVGANRFHETSASAYQAGPNSPASQCASSGATLCYEAGRTYIYRGEDVAGSDPAVNLETPLATIKNPVAQGPDFGIANQGSEIENFGHVQTPIGDVGRCRVGLVGGVTYPAVAAGDRCVPTSSTNVPDGFPELLVASHRADYPVANPDPAMFDVGVVFLIDGATRSILTTYFHPEPQPGSAFGFMLQNPFPAGDMGFGNAADNADFPASAFRQNAGGVTGSGRDYLMNGNFKAGTNTYSFGQLNDPTPSIGGNFGTAWSALGDLVPAERKNELIIGGFASQPSRDLAVTDVWIFNAFYEKALQRIEDPDQQPNSKFGSRLAPMGDLNGDGFLDFAVAADGWDNPATAGGADNNNGRIYVFRSDNSPVPPPPPPVAAPPPPPPPPPSPPPPSAVTASGRNVSLSATPTKVRAGRPVKLAGTIKELVNNSGCVAGKNVTIQRSATRNGTFKALKTVKSSSKGAFSLTLKPAKTYYYRARVFATPTCLSATSPRVRVRVTRRAR